MTNPQIENLEKVAAILANVPEQFVFTAEIEGSCDEVQPVAKILLPYTFQRLNFPDQLNPIF